ncbi:MAG: class I SAM-dependent methyltransferase [Pseudomonadota bacterium]
MTWDGGYPSELPYTSSYYVEHAPAHLRLVPLLRGIHGPRIKDGFRLLELGCGSGTSMVTMAAANPLSEFVGIDFAPAQIATGNRLIEKSGLTNVELVEADFLEIQHEAGEIFGQFDYVICHGVYTWVSNEIRSALVQILKGVMAPGGVLFMGYNSMPGWSGAFGLQRLISDFAKYEHGDTDIRVREAIRKVKALSDQGFQGINFDYLPPSIRDSLDDLDSVPKANFRYVAHEYLSQAWSPIFRGDLVRDLSEAKLSLVGSTRLLDAFPETLGSEEQRALMGQVSPELGPQLMEMIAPPRFRRDVFIKGRAPLTDQQRAQQLADTPVALVRTASEFEYEVDVHRGTAEIPKVNYEPLIDALEGRPRALGDLLEMSRSAGSNLSPEELMGMLITSCQVMPAADADAQATEMTRQANRALIEFALNDPAAHQLALASAVLGAGLPTETANMALYDIVARTKGTDVEPDVETMKDELIAAILGRGEAFLQDGEQVDDPEQIRKIAGIAIDKGLTDFSARWSALGMI